MKQVMFATCCAAAVSVALPAAQSGSMDKSKMDKGMKDATVMVTGCVSEGSGGHYMLTNAVMSEGMKGEMKGDMKPMSYDLMGGDLKAHLGHRVEVTGSRGKMDKKMDKATMDKDKTAMMSGDRHDMLTVKSVKMISTTCP